MEVLAPAGSIEAFKAALLAGADAIYLGGKRFGARRFAQNFSNEELAGAIALAHERGVKVYVTVNTLVKQSELGDALDYLWLLKDVHADAAIIQDRGLIPLARDEVGIPIHASTQMGIHTPEGARWAQESGLERVILARELTLEQVGAIASSVDIGLEVFVHGALCYCFSGQCLLSSVVGGRSGNRGMCAQPCRKRYRLGQEIGYLLSTSDLFCIDALPELKKLGVAAVKIEGRMRSPSYVHYTTKAYKQALVRAERGESPLVTEREKELMWVAYNRGYSGGYLLCADPVGRANPESRGFFLGEVLVREGQLTGVDERLKIGDGLTLYRGDEKVGGFGVQTDGSEMRIPFRLLDGKYRAYKTKDREFEQLDRAIDETALKPLTVHASHHELNTRSRARSQRRPELSAYVSSMKTLARVLPFVDRVYYEWAERLEEARELCGDAGKEFVPLLPRVSPIIPEVDEGPVMVCSADQAASYRDRRLFGHYSMNVFNSLSALGFYQCTASVELSRSDLRELASCYPGRLEVLAFGRIELMITKDPGIKQGSLIDERGASFPVYRDPQGYAHVLNSAELLLLDFAEELEGMGIDSLGLDLRRKNPDLAGLVASAFAARDVSKKSAIKRKVGAITAGHYLRGVE